MPERRRGRRRGRWTCKRTHDASASENIKQAQRCRNPRTDAIIALFGTVYLLTSGLPRHSQHFINS